MQSLLDDLKAKKSAASLSVAQSRKDQDAVYAAEKLVHDAIQQQLRDTYGDLFEDIRVTFYPRQK